MAAEEPTRAQELSIHIPFLEADLPDPERTRDRMKELCLKQQRKRSLGVSEDSRFQLPGWTLPIDHPQQKYDDKGRAVLFTNALNIEDLHGGWASLPLLTLREIAIIRLLNGVTDKEGWESKAFDEEIIAEWKNELRSDPDSDFSEKMIEWFIKELQHKVKVFKDTGVISAFDADVVKSDVAVPESLRHALIASVKPLEDVPEAHKDWHPGSNEQVLDLVHPSLFPLLYGQSRILPNHHVSLENCIELCGKGEIIPQPSGVPPSGFSHKFQWLPCDVDITSDAKVTSCINNLHPQRHQDLYAIVEKIIDKSIPLWNTTLTALRRSITRPIRIPYTDVEYEPTSEEVEAQRPTQAENETEDDFMTREEEWEKAQKVLIKPEPIDFDNWLRSTSQVFHGAEADLAVDLRSEYGPRGLQVIVKLANIELTPEKPEYAGGSWHVEGQLNEHIVATALYYYDLGNVTDSPLAFRQQSAFDWDTVSYEQDDHDWLEKIFGCENYVSQVQELGWITPRTGRLVTFPNTLQHCVGSFKLEDATRPGHRKVLALFLVDPNVRVISTANVPCQRADWWAERLQGREGSNDRIASLPGEVRDMIVERVDEFPISLDEAKKLREELMAERTDWGRAQNEMFIEQTFSLCEH